MYPISCTDWKDFENLSERNAVTKHLFFLVMSKIKLSIKLEVFQYFGRILVHYWCQREISDCFTHYGIKISYHLP